MALFRTPRGLFYLLALFSALLQMNVAQTTAKKPGKSPYLDVISNVSGIVAIATWVWIAVLFAHSNSQPTSPHPLSRPSIHIISFIVISVAWLGLGTLTMTQVPAECVENTGRCQPAMSAVILAFFTSLFSGLSGAIMYDAAVASKAESSVHVTQRKHSVLAKEEIIPQ